MTFVEERVRQIESAYVHVVRNVLVLHLTEETFRLILFLRDGTSLRVAERWRGGNLVRYSYYWLDTQERLKIGWDNAPHHRQLENFPYHKHMGEQAHMIPSYETSLEEVMAVLEQQIARAPHC